MIKCLYGGCPKTFVDEEIREYVTPDLFGKYKKFKLQQIKLNNPNRNFVNCPIADCEDIVEINEEPDETMLDCAFGHQFCSKCKTEGWHKKGKCREV
jgi:hypothetical protein